MFWNAQRRPREENVAAFSVERPERAASLPNRRFAARPHTPFLGKPAVSALVQNPFTFRSEENVAAFSVERPERAASLPNRRFAARPHTPFLGKPAVSALVQTPFTFGSRRAARRGLATPPRHRAGSGAGASALDSAARAG